MTRAQEDKFWPLVVADPGSGCWHWGGFVDKRGYGRFSLGARKNIGAHRILWEHEHGHVANGLELDHVCRNRACVNPAHMEAVTSRENTLRGDGPTARHARKTHCLRGHALSGDNLKIRCDGRRICRACYNARRKSYRAQSGGAR